MKEETMAHIHLPSYEEMDPEIQEKARPILEKTGDLGEIFQLLAVRKDIFFATDQMATAYLLKETELPFRIKESIALLVSAENGCKMCVDLHKRIAMMLGMQPEEVEKVLQGIDAMVVHETAVFHDQQALQQQAGYLVQRHRRTVLVAQWQNAAQAHRLKQCLVGLLALVCGQSTDTAMGKIDLHPYRQNPPLHAIETAQIHRGLTLA
jgi:AhpD family alkylhydroperoxidase